MAQLSHTAFLFPGQGSQSIGMLASLAQQSPLVQETFAEASELAGADLWQLSQLGPKERLDQTEITQPAMLAADIACWRVWKEQGGYDPAFMAGHSLGEYAALVAASRLDFADAVRLVVQRAKLMQKAVPEGAGAMAAILGMDDADLERVCAEVAEGEVVSCANFNSPGQTVIAGHRTAVDRACAAAKNAGAKRAVSLPVSVPSHCMLMREAAIELEESLQHTAVTTSEIIVIHNADVKNHASGDAVRKALAEQLWKPVRWSETIAAMVAQQVNRYAECGPGGVLTGLNRRNARDAETVALSEMDTVQKSVLEWN